MKFRILDPPRITPPIYGSYESMENKRSQIMKLETSVELLTPRSHFVICLRSKGLCFLSG